MFDSVEGLDAKRVALQQRIRKLTIEEEEKLQKLRKEIDVEVRLISTIARTNDPWDAKVLSYKMRITTLLSLYRQVMRVPGMQAAEHSFIALQEIYKGLLDKQTTTFTNSEEFQRYLGMALAKEREGETALNAKISGLDRSLHNQ